MAEPKRIDYNRIGNISKSSMDKPQWESNLKAFQNFETKVEVEAIHAELRKADVTTEKLADRLRNQQDFFTTWTRPVAANKALLKAMYQPE